jgi:uncharacterized protein
VKLAGEVALHAPAERVWCALTERLDAGGTFVVTAGAAAARGTYAGEVTVLDRQPRSVLLVLSAAGAPGTVRGQVRLELDGTRLRYDSDATVTGMLAGMGQRMLAAIAHRIACEFVATLDQQLAGRRAEPLPDEPSALAAPPAGARAFAAGALIGAILALGGVSAARHLARRRPGRLP